ncbi:MAG: alpha-galactosidase [Erysipelotrichaceae bacterium]|nr:alpha-galactosidase [Erysipelotrichaceae bacterium]
MINYFEPYFKLDTNHTTYCFKVLETGHLEHLHYGDYLFGESADDLHPLSRQRAFGVGNSIAYDEEHQELTLENVCLEFGTKGKGDLREPLIDVTLADGSTTRDFLYVSHVIDDSEPDLKGMPGSYGDCEHLCITLKDQNSDLVLKLHYHVYAKYDVITRYSELINEGEEGVIINRLLSNQIDFDQTGLVMTTFNGAWAREMMRYDHHVTSGSHVNMSTTGTSSSRANPFVMISRTETNDHIGRCYGFNLIYSGNHYESFSVNAFDQSRFVQGINPDFFAYRLEAGETFMSPEAIMSYDNHGFNDLSSHFHAFINDCIVRGSYKHKERPILLNSWEAAYFNIDERRLLRLARKAKEAGIELFVMDDGWFGERNDDTSSLGDWYVNEKKLPKGLDGIASKINDMGMEFGLWVEPEMVNPNSHLYRQHPEWILGHPTHHQSLGRHQCILDLCNPEVVDYLFKTMSNVFSAANISYIKWDMNRNISDYYSPYLDAEHQSEVGHRYVLGLYNLMERLTTAFPYILFEDCASGGNRFDLGILSYFPQIWASDDTDAIYRLEAQQNYSYGYHIRRYT